MLVGALRWRSHTSALLPAGRRGVSARTHSGRVTPCRLPPGLCGCPVGGGRLPPGALSPAAGLGLWGVLGGGCGDGTRGPGTACGWSCR